MKKTYTVDELLSSKKDMKESNSMNEQQSKLQHLKIGNSNIAQAEKLFQSIQEDTEQETKPSMTSREIYDLVVWELKNDGHKVNKEDIDYLTEVVKSTLANPDSDMEAPKPRYVFVNPYTKKLG